MPTPRSIPSAVDLSLQELVGDLRAWERPPRLSLPRGHSDQCWVSVWDLCPVGSVWAPGQWWRPLLGVRRCRSCTTPSWSVCGPASSCAGGTTPPARTATRGVRPRPRTGSTRTRFTCSTLSTRGLETGKPRAAGGRTSNLQSTAGPTASGRVQRASQRSPLA